MDSIPPADPDLALEALSMRVEREITRLAGGRSTQTEMVGGWAKIGAAVDHLLRASFIRLCAAIQAPPDATFARLTREAWDLQRASAGQLLRAVRALAPSILGRSPSLDRLARHLADPTLAMAVELRNELVHQRREPTREELGAVLRALRAWIAAARG
ncbi:MAG: hypothetical protein U0325_26780 [Polyangiales bacterium]